MFKLNIDHEGIRNGISRNKLLQLKILFIGLVVGIGFAWLLEPSGKTRIYTVLATVQGSFLAISISVVLLSFQITSNEYTALSLEDIQHELRLNRVILIFVISILLDLYYETNQRYDLISIMAEPNNSTNGFSQLIIDLFSPSVAAGTAIGLATVCLLQIIPIRNRMVETVGPESLLNSRVATLEVDDVPRLDQRSLNEPPQRNPLLTIDQILNAAKRRNDEFTIRRSIFEMERATSKLIELNQQRDGSLDEDALFEYWSSCIDIACEGGMRRMAIAARAKCDLIESLFGNNCDSAISGRVDDLFILTQEALDRGEYQELFLAEYSAICGYAAHANNSEITAYVTEKISSVADHLLIVEDENRPQTLTPQETAQLVERVSYIGYSSLLLSINLRAGEQSKRREVLKSLLFLVKKLNNTNQLDHSNTKSLQRRTAQLLSATIAAGLSRDDMQLTRIALKSVVEISLSLDESVNETLARVENGLQDRDKLWPLFTDITRSFPREDYERAVPEMPNEPEPSAIKQRFESVFDRIRSQA